MIVERGRFPDADVAGGEPCLLVHGGAWDIPDEACADHLDGLRQALAVGSDLLRRGTEADEVAAETVAVLEAHGAFDAGVGAVLNAAGAVELDAGVMCGATLRYGAVAQVRRHAQPVRVARALMHQGRREVCFLARDEAEAFARRQGFAEVDNSALICHREQQRYERLRAEAASYHTSHTFVPGRTSQPTGTVGCAVRDARGRLAASTSTGGTPFKPPGRIGDSPLPGCGFYANAAGAASATGWGEAVAAMVLCKTAIDRLDDADVTEAAASALDEMFDAIRNADGDGARGGLIVLPAHGHGTWAYTTHRMARGGWSPASAAWVDI